MIKKILINQLKPGMYVCDLNCSWLDHPFARSRFRLSGGEQLAKIRKLGVKDLCIDTSRGLDVQDAPTAPKVKEQLDKQLQQTAGSSEAEARKTILAEERGGHGRSSSRPVSWLPA